MCGRFAIYSSVQSIIDYAKALSEIDSFEPNYNAAPEQNIPIILKENGRKILKLFRWGLIPFWAKKGKIGYKLINAKAETIAEKPSFKYAFQKRRCLIPANGFYEWDKDKQPFYFHLKEQNLFSFAGIWDKWKSPEGREVYTCCIITTTPNKQVQKIHNRMPVILEEEDEQKWLNNELFSKVQLLSLLRPISSDKIVLSKVSKEVNSIKNNYKELLLLS